MKKTIMLSTMLLIFFAIFAGCYNDPNREKASAGQDNENGHVHSYDTNKWEYDETYHWHPATCEHSSEKGDFEQHIFMTNPYKCKCGYDKNLLKGEFTVNSSGKKVRFTRGNLQAQYDGSKFTWAFPKNQYVNIGGRATNDVTPNTGNNRIGNPSQNDVIDLFAWSTDNSSSKYGINDLSQAYKGNFVDWGGNFGGEYVTLSGDEWTYLISREGKCGLATISIANNGFTNKYKGLILLPDGEWDGSVSFKPGKTEEGFSANEYDAEQWSNMEAKGAVFLPAAGTANYASGLVNVDGNGMEGNYWTASSFSDDAARILFFHNVTGFEVYQNKGSGIEEGYSVRLVSIVE